MSNPDPSIIVIFGASGDLTRRKLLPAVYNLAESHLLPEAFAILGIARPPIDDTVFRSDMRKIPGSGGISKNVSITRTATSRTLASMSS